MTKGKRPRREAAGGGDGRGRGHDGGGGGYNNGNYQGHGNWGNTPNYPTAHPNYNPQMGQACNTYQGQGNWTNIPNYPTPHPNYNPQMGQGYNTYQFEPNVPWQPGNEPSNPFSQSHQASQTQQSQNNENDGFADDAESLPDAEDNEESNVQVPVQTEPGVCGTCKMPGHEVIQCWQMGPDGFTHGCGVCNSGAHETDQCQSFPQDLDGKIEILVKRRACLPPLKTAFWYSMMWKWVKKNPSTDVNHLFPWTTKFAIDVLNGDRKSEVEGMLATIRNDPSIERSEFIVDPATANWEKVKETYGGDPKNFFEKLRATKGADQEQRVTNVGKLPSS
ncbi:uncharacterized protein FTJAE_10786 [Fusarium tjaetaba]|uniref:Uncharacterized protein n=1 Tax=Fusarium tjaetaba TaxID=1567544 RepID=A0A8H5QYC3_9HYPO|nr:uncharacterized protein FTJAE_10786 [Fusarium tjaetaba]KAF5622807.1 hypothetical protein FTJAE_10786 [Fusarium tjaetaba]